MKFLDQVKIFIKAGDGGSGSPSFRREKFIEFLAMSEKEQFLVDNPHFKFIFTPIYNIHNFN